MQTDKFKKSHLYFNVVDVGREAEGDFSVVCVVFAVSNVDVHLDLVFLRFDQHSGEVNEKCQQLACDAHISPPGCSHALEQVAANKVELLCCE